MAREQGPSTSRTWPGFSFGVRTRGRPKAAEEGSEAEHGVEKLGREVCALEGELSEKQRELEAHKRRLEAQLKEQLRPLRREIKQVQRKLLAKRRRLEEVESTNCMDKLPQEVWDKILDHLDENDLFPLALSCRYFRQKQKELVERKTRENGPGSGKSRLALKTTVWRKVEFAEPASANYLRFCSKEKVSKDVELHNDSEIVRLAAFHGHLRLLGELMKRLRLGEFLKNGGLGKAIAGNAGESSFPLSLWVLSSDFLLSCLPHSARRPSGDLGVAENSGWVQAGSVAL